MCLLRSNTLYRFSKLYQKEQSFLRILHRETDNVIRERRELIKSWDLDKVREEMSGSSYEGHKKRLAFLDMFLIAQMEHKGITDSEIREETDTYIIAGQWTRHNKQCHFIRSHKEAMEFVGREQESMKYEYNPQGLSIG